MSNLIEREMLERLVPELVAEGYEVFVQPNKSLVPVFLGTFRPDAIAMRDDKNLVVEVLQQSPRASKTLKDVTKLLEGQKKWELHVVWIEASGSQTGLSVQGIETIEASISGVERVMVGGHSGPALLIAWATFEAIARALAKSKFERPQTPGRLVEILSTDGYLTPTESDHMRSFAKKRNSLIHGELQVHVSDQEIKTFMAILRVLSNLLPKSPATMN